MPPYFERPFVKRRAADRVLAQNLSQRQATFGLAQNPHDLRTGKTALPHPNLLVATYRENSTFKTR